MSVNYLVLLENKHNELKSISDTHDRLTKEITYIESIIPEFFSNAGEANSIKKMYHDIKVAMESPLFNKKIPCIDINRGSHIYNEYVDGMIQFIGDIQAINESASVGSYEDKFTSARDKDELFVNSLYGGNLNKAVETSINEATENIEFLIDFIPELKVMQEKCDKIYSESVMEDDSEKSKLVKESTDMLYESVANYCYQTVKSIFECYNDIQQSLDNKPVKSKEEFILF